MTIDYPGQVTLGLLLLSLISLLAIGLLASFLALIYYRGSRGLDFGFECGRGRPKLAVPCYRPAVFENACRWAVIKCSHVSAVQAALGLHNPTPCSWGEGLGRLTSQKLFISPPVRGWIVVIGLGLPDPSDDPDRCFHFVLKLSRALGQVQLFAMDRTLHHHAWIRAESGEIRRAYVWAGETLWNQGELTPAEVELEMKCFDYTEQPSAAELLTGKSPAANSERFMSLAAGWSIDPSTVDENLLRVGLGVAGDLAHSKQH